MNDFPLLNTTGQNQLNTFFESREFTLEDVITPDKMNNIELNKKLAQYSDTQGLEIKKPSPTEKELFEYSICNNKVSEMSDNEIEKAIKIYNTDELTIQQEENNEVLIKMIKDRLKPERENELSEEKINELIKDYKTGNIYNNSYLQ